MLLQKLLFSLSTFLVFFLVSPAQNQLGIFENAQDVGPVLHQGQTLYDMEKDTYTLSGAGANIWFQKDEFQYASKRIKGDFIVRTRAKLLGDGVDPHRKLGWMVRSSMDTSAAMICATVHGDGLTAIQFRKEDGMNIEEVKSPIHNPDVIQLERRGRSFLMSVARFGDPFWTVEIPDINFPKTMNVGLFICSHNAETVEQAIFENVRIVIPAPADFQPYRDYIGSHIEILDLASGKRKIIYSASNSLQAPNWTPDGKTLIYNSEGKIYTLDIASNQSQRLNTDFVDRNNNDHVLSFDGQMIGLSSSSGEADYGSLIYTVPVGGGVPKRITPIGPSYLHGWSPDRKWLCYTAGRNDAYNIYKIPADGSGPEVQLTHEQSLDDGPEYSPDGRFIYFNSSRSASMELWRMQPDGTEQQQLTDDHFQNWFPHLSPDGKWIVFLSYQASVPAADHPFYKHVYIRRMPAEGGRIEVMAYLYGGQGTINVPSWSPDGSKVAFVSNTVLE